MEDIRTKSENTTPRQRAAAQIPKEAMRQLWLRSKEKGRTEIESTADGQQGGQYSEANQTGEKVSDALQSVGNIASLDSSPAATFRCTSSIGANSSPCSSSQS